MVKLLTPINSWDNSGNLSDSKQATKKENLVIDLHWKSMIDRGQFKEKSM